MDQPSITGTGLQISFEDLAFKAAERRRDLEKVSAAIEDLATQLADSSKNDRQALIKKRRDLAAEREALQDEVRVFERRRDIAHLAINELHFSLAEAEARRMDELVRAHRVTLNDAINDRLHFYNGGRGKLSAAEGDNKSIELEKRVAGLKAEAEILTRDASRAGRARDLAAAELKNTRLELGIEEGQ